MSQHLLAVDRTTLLFLASADSSREYVAQVTVKSSSVKTHAFAEASYWKSEIENTVVKIVVAHLGSTSLTAPVVVVGNGYTLRAEHKPWTLGRQYVFGTIGADGAMRAAPSAAVKWNFVVSID